MTLGEQVLSFYRELKIRKPLPDGIEVLNPYQDDASFSLCRAFYRKYYNDHLERFFILGINPGRFGAGITGIPFTDPIKLEMICGIKNTFPKKAELSADFIHAMIAAIGGPDIFFSKFYINSVSPLGFIKSGKNLNYYDTPQLMTSLEPFIRDSIKSQLNFGLNRQVAFCLGEGTNFKYLQKLNDKEKYFKQIIPLAHPRFIMQYKRKHVARYLEDYLQKLNSVL
jgi:hypothetical protein